jgi:predicted dehydrogenase
MGMIGGGEGAFIGPIHRMAAELDGRVELVCGAFSADAERSRRSGVSRYGLDVARCYADWRQMLEREAALPRDRRMHFVTIVTPNHLHFPAARDALLAGFDVVCDKPLCLDVEQAEALVDMARAHQRRFAVTYNYTGYPMVRQARALVAQGALGPIRRVVCEYLQGWLATDQRGNKQADWRTDPARAGAAGCFGDIGAHCENLVRYVSGLRIDRVCADLSSFVPGRSLDDDGNVLLRFAGGARGVMLVSQVAAGEENGLCLRVYGERGGLVWRQQEPNSLQVLHHAAPAEVFRTGGSGLAPAAVAATRLPAGHPEGYLEAFAVLYRAFAAEALDDTGAPVDYPTLEDGLWGMRFLAAVVDSAGRGSAWVDVDPQEVATA